MAIAESKVLQSLKRDLKDAEPTKLTWDVAIRTYKDQYHGKPYGNETAGKSAIVSRDIKKQSEWQHASIIDPFVSSPNVVKCSPITFEDTKAAHQNELLLNAQFCRKFDRYNFMSKAIKVLDMEGTLVVQTGWEYEDEDISYEAEVVATDEFGNEFITKQTVHDKKIIKNQPTAKICRNEDIFIDPTCEDNLDLCQFVIYRYQSDLSTLSKDGRYKNLDKLKGSLGSINYDSTYRPEDVTRFQFSDDARKKLIVYEYWGNFDINEDGIAEAIVCTWVGDTIIRLEENPYPDGKPPFLIVPFNKVPFQMHGEANAELIGDNQKIKTAIIRGIIDNMAQSNNGQIGIRKGVLDLVNRKRMFQGKHFEFNGTVSDFYQGSYNQIPKSAFDMLGLMNNEIEALTGIKSFSGGINGATLGPSATAARGAMDAMSTRRANIVRNISENLVIPLLRKWMVYNAEFLSDEEVVRVTNDQFIPVRRDDLSGAVDIDLTVSTAEDNAAKSQELSFLLQTVGPNEDPAIRKEIMAQIMELMRMPENAKKLREYQPQPDPMAEQMKQLQLENMKLTNLQLRSEIERNYARAGEDQIDMQLKQQKIAVEAAKARHLDSRADLDDMEFLRLGSNVSHKDKAELELAKLRLQLAEKENDHYRTLEHKDADHQRSLEALVLKHKSDLDKLAFNAEQQDKNRLLDTHKAVDVSMHQHADRVLDNHHRNLDRQTIKRGQ